MGVLTNPFDNRDKQRGLKNDEAHTSCFTHAGGLIH